MEKQMMFHILGIAETRDENAIKTAYRNLLKTTNPEDDPEGFKRLREAYEGACAYARQPAEEAEEPEETEYDLWIGRVDKVYSDIRRRTDPDEWSDLLADPICEDLDTSLAARDALLIYLMDHIFLPRRIWQLIDRTFQITDDRQNLADRFSDNYLDYIAYYTENEEFIDFSLFRIIDEDTADADAYIQEYMELKRQLDAHPEGEGLDRAEWLTAWDGLSAYGLFHPYQDCLRIWLDSFTAAAALKTAGCEASLSENDRLLFSQVRQKADSLILENPDHTYILTCCGTAYWNLGLKEKAYGIYSSILSRHPDHTTAKYYAIRYLMETGDYLPAKEYLLDLLDIDGSNEDLLEYMYTANEFLIGRYTALIADPAEADDRPDNTMELAWCLFQNERLDEAIAILADFTPGEKQLYSYVNLYGRLLYRAERYEEALPRLKQWLDMIRATTDDGTEEMKKRISRRFRACHILSGCCYELDDKEQSLAYVDEAIEAAGNIGDWLAASQYKAWLLFQYRQYERCIDVCDQIADKEPEYFPAYLQRQEAAFKLMKGQQVVDDYYRAISIFSGYYKPYLLAAQVFFYHSQYRDAAGVFEKARENGVEFTPNMMLYEVKVLRNLAKSEEDRKVPLEMLKTLAGLRDEHLARQAQQTQPAQDTAQPQNAPADGRPKSTPDTKQAQNASAGGQPQNTHDTRQPQNTSDTKQAPASENRPEESSRHPGRKKEPDPEHPGFDIEDPSEIEFEISLLEWDRGHLDAALRRLGDAIAQNPDRLQYRLIRGHIYLDKNSYKLALDEYRAAEDGYSDAATLYYSRAECYEGLGMKELARENLEKALRLQEGFRDTCWKLSNYYKERYTAKYDPEDLKKAEDYLNRQLAASENCYYLVERGRLHMASYDLELAVADFEKALSYDPNDWAACNNLGCCYKYLGDFRKAIEYLERSVRCLGDEKNVLPYSNMADCYEAMHDYRGAIRCYEKDLELFPYQMFLYEEIGLLYSYLGDYEKALEYLNKAPERENYCENAALIHYLTGGKHKAVRFYEKRIAAAQERESKARLLYDFGCFCSDYLNDFSRAAACFKRGVFLSSDPSRLFDLEWRMAITLYRAGKRNDAKAHALKALKHFSEDEGVSEDRYLQFKQYRPARLLRFGWLKICLGQEEEGLSLLKEMTMCTRCRTCRYPECFESYLFRGWYWEAAKNLREALACYRKAKEINPHDPQIQERIFLTGHDNRN